MARKKRRKKGWLRTVLVFVLAPLIVWFGVFIIWLFWSDIVKNFTPGKDASKAPAKAARMPEIDQKPGRTGDQPPTEEIHDADRKSLDEIIKRKN